MLIGTWEAVAKMTDGDAVKLPKAILVLKPNYEYVLECAAIDVHAKGKWVLEGKDQSPLSATVTKGIVSARKMAKRGDWKWIQTDAAVYHGTSGAPAFNGRARVIGVAAMISQDRSRGGEIAPGMNYLAPISVVKEFLDRAKADYIGRAGSSP